MTEPAAQSPTLPPDSPEPDGPAQPSGPRRVARIALQCGGFIAGLALLGWCVSLAFKPENRHQLEHLREASPAQLLGLLGLSLATLLVNGLIFWVTIRPARRLRAPDVLATNAIATFLGYLPFKLGLVVRIAIHNRRDRLPLLTIGAWFAAMAITLSIAIWPPALAGLWRKTLDGPWLLTTAAAVISLTAAAILMARHFAGPPGLARLHRVFGRLPIAGPAMHTRAFTQLHSGFDMLGHPRSTTAAVGLRLLDLVIISARFALASAIIGAPIPWDSAFLVAATFFIIGLLSPFGVLGTREAGVTGIAALLLPGGDSAGQNFAIVALLVSATEAIAYLAAAGVGLAWLRPDRLFRSAGDTRILP